VQLMAAGIGSLNKVGRQESFSLVFFVLVNIIKYFATEQ